MSIGKSWAPGYRANRYGKGEDQTACPNGRAKCWCCSRPDLAAYKAAKAAGSDPDIDLSDSWGDLSDESQTEG